MTTGRSQSSRIARIYGIVASPSVAMIVLVIGLGFQLRGVYRSGSIQSIPDTLARLAQPAWERGVKWVLGDTIADYVRFVHDRTPEDASIVLPPHSVVQPFAEVGLMQFYFFPRKVYNCGPNEVEACMYRARTTHTYVLAMPHFPPAQEALKYKDYIPFNEHFGLYVPKTEPDAGGG